MSCTWKKINEDGDEIGEIHGVICQLQKDEILEVMNEENLELMENEMPPNCFR